MFESVIIRNNDISKVDIGLLAECLLFYNKVYLMADMTFLRLITSAIGLDTLEKLIKNRHIVLIFSPRMPGTLTIGESTPEEHFDFGTFVKLRKGQREPDFEQLFFETLEKGSGKKGKSRRVGNRILKDTTFFDPIKDIPIHNGIPEIARYTLNNKLFIKNAVKFAIKYFAPNYSLPPNWEFNTIRHDKGFSITTNIDMIELNKYKNKRYFIDPKSHLTKAFLINNVLKANEDLYLAAHYQSELITNSLISQIISLRCKDIIERTDRSQNSTKIFQDFVFHEAKTISEVINSGEKKIDDLIPLLDRSKRFKKWLKEHDEDIDLVKEYYKEITASTWIDKLPAKSSRFVIFFGAGLALDNLLAPGVGTISSLTLGIIDSFIIDKFAKKWKPNQYISKVEDFLKQK